MVLSYMLLRWMRLIRVSRGSTRLSWCYPSSYLTDLFYLFLILSVNRLHYGHDVVLSLHYSVAFGYYTTLISSRKCLFCSRIKTKCGNFFACIALHCMAKSEATTTQCINWLKNLMTQLDVLRTLSINADRPFLRAVILAGVENEITPWWRCCTQAGEQLRAAQRTSARKSGEVSFQSGDRIPYGEAVHHRLGKHHADVLERQPCTGYVIWNSKLSYSWIYIALNYEIFLESARDGTCLSGSHSFTCYPHVYSAHVESNEASCLTPQPHSITAFWLVVGTHPAEGRRLSWHE